jgi:hypothetical protein
VIRQRAKAYGHAAREYHRVTVAWLRRLWAFLAAFVSAVAITALANAFVRVAWGGLDGPALVLSVVGQVLLFVLVAAGVYRSTLTAPARRARARDAT